MSFDDPIKLVTVHAELLVAPLDRPGRLAKKFHSEPGVGSDLDSRSKFDRAASDAVLWFSGYQD
ncbi:hypothetical protein O2N63_01660 [Aliiroseovarius sp. KMU-50]|uniref:Uncharacterized protein n=1 Tax=Aliiroseovarius salicola TaxID=3009082 RepID=A0ABT4VX20_9RHOB|nr:hypothetical protein [Aliiroseovarius sp. KMU-50]MDA5092790.1 hypothetical protein [Aliiroseovarius sp. KMU-50]